MDDLDADDVRSPRTRRVAMIGTLVAIALAAVTVVVVVARPGHSAPAKRELARIDRGDVVATIAGIGTLRARTTASLSFGSAGRIVAVEVEPGERVRKGQILALLDNRVARARLAAAEASHVASQAALSQLIAGRSTPERRQSAAQIGAADDALRSSVRLVRAARSVAHADTASQRNALQQARATQRSAEHRLRVDAARLRRVGATFTTLDQQLVTLRTALGQLREQQLDRTRMRRDHLSHQLDATNDRSQTESALADARAEVGEARAAMTTAVTNLNQACGSGGGASDCTVANQALTAAQSALVTAQARAERLQASANSAVQSTTDIQKSLLDDDVLDAELSREIDAAQARFSDAQAERDRARAERDSLRTSLPTTRETARTATQSVATAHMALGSGRATANQSLASAVQSVTAARSALALARATTAVDDQPPRPGALTAARQALAAAQGGVVEARQELESTVLRAPSDGVVTRVGLAAGDTVSGGGAAQASTSASDTPSGGQPSGGASDGAGGGGPAGDAGAIVVNSGRPTLFSVPLTQADAIRARVGSTATITLHATRSFVAGRLIRLTPEPTTTNGVVTYAATLAATRLPPRMKPGMTGDVTIIVAQRDGVVRAPVSAVPATGRAVRVRVARGGSTIPRPVVLGLRGDQHVQIVSGLRPGDRIVVPPAPAPSWGP